MTLSSCPTFVAGRFEYVLDCFYETSTIAHLSTPLGKLRWRDKNHLSRVGLGVGTEGEWAVAPILCLSGPSFHGAFVCSQTANLVFSLAVSETQVRQGSPET